MSVKQKLSAGVTIVWGTSGVSSQGYGKLLSVSIKRASQKEKIPDEEGNTCGVVYFDEEDTLMLEVLCKSSMSEPAIGDTVTADSTQGYIDDFEKKWDHKGTKKLSVTASRFVNNTLPS